MIVLSANVHHSYFKWASGHLYPQFWGPYHASMLLKMMIFMYLENIVTQAAAFTTNLVFESADLKETFLLSPYLFDSLGIYGNGLIMIYEPEYIF
jgi:hypothetical protein